ncbi:MAG: glycosyltransferase family 1 protein [Nitrospiraceae bacterium]|nr:MAG: glycosyltransferase family 1 protein [Nitrospiraceae bacterium]
MNILHTETLKKWGGQQNRVLSEASGLSKRGHHVIIACHKGSVLAEKAKNEGIRVYELNMTKQSYLTAIPKLMNIIRKEHIDIVSTHSSVDSWAGGLAARLTGRKLIRFRHNLFVPGSSPLTNFIYAIPDRIITVSAAVREVLAGRKMKKEKMTVIPDAFDPSVFDTEAADIRQELGVSPDMPVIGNTSTFSDVKGQEYLLQAFNIISEKYPCILLFAGRLIEPSRSRYLSYVKESLRDRVILLGHRDDIPQVLKTIDIFVYPSWFEGLGTALLEAMAMQRPAVISDIPTFHEFIEDRVNGLFFKVKDPEDMAEKVIALMQDNQLRQQLGSNARAAALERFTIDRMLDMTEAVYKEVLHAA